jgi:hypothetical protein
MIKERKVLHVGSVYLDDCRNHLAVLSTLESKQMSEKGMPFGQVDVRTPMKRDIVYIPLFGCWYKLSAYSNDTLLCAAARSEDGLPDMNDEGVVNWSIVSECPTQFKVKLEGYFGDKWTEHVIFYTKPI